MLVFRLLLIIFVGVDAWKCPKIDITKDLFKLRLVNIVPDFFPFKMVEALSAFLNVSVLFSFSFQIIE
jgi:hypothetical protein